MIMNSSAANQPNLVVGPYWWVLELVLLLLLLSTCTGSVVHVLCVLDGVLAKDALWQCAQI
jgi:hypothetical protein